MIQRNATIIYSGFFIGMDSCRLSGGKRAQIPLGTGYRPPVEQKNTPNPARRVSRRHLRQKKVSFPARNGIPTAFRAEKFPKSCADDAPRRLRAEKGIFSCAEWDANRLPSRKTPQILRGRCLGGIWSRKRYHFLRGMGYQPPSEQKNAPNSARKVPRGGSGQKNSLIPARNGMPTVCRAEKHHKYCAEGASEASRAEKHPKSCAEWDANRLRGRKFKINLVKCQIIITFARSNVWRFQFLNVFETINNV